MKIEYTVKIEGTKKMYEDYAAEKIKEAIQERVVTLGGIIKFGMKMEISEREQQKGVIEE